MGRVVVYFVCVLTLCNRVCVCQVCVCTCIATASRCVMPCVITQFLETLGGSLGCAHFHTFVAL